MGLQELVPLSPARADRDAACSTDAIAYRCQSVSNRDTRVEEGSRNGRNAIEKPGAYGDVQRNTGRSAV